MGIELQSILKEESYSNAAITLPYRVFIPPRIRSDCRFILYLHGAGERGTDNRKHIETNNQFLERYFSQGYDTRFPAVILAPQCAETRPDGTEGKWVNKNWGEGSFPELREESQELEAVIDLCKQYIEQYNLPQVHRIVTGISMGGFGTWDILVRYPGLFRTAVPICGGGCLGEADKVKGTRIWTFHGDADPVVPVTSTQAMVKAVQEAGISLQYTEYADVEHGSWDPAYKEPALFSWLFDFAEMGAIY